MNLVFSGPSGAGKGTITELLITSDNFRKFITCTTRKPRDNERDGFDYYLIEEEKFLNLVNNGEIFNVKQYGGNYYGSYEKDMDFIETDKNVIFQLTPDRALQMKKRNQDTCLILILPPNADVLNVRRKDRSCVRISDDIQNLEIAKNFDYVVINDDLDKAMTEVLDCIESFKTNKKSKHSVSDNIKIIDDFICGIRNSRLSSSVEEVFNGDVSKHWDDKSRFVTYHGVKNPITNEVLSSIRDGIKVIDIGCGTGKLLSKIDKKIVGSYLTGLDISSGMITSAQNRIFTGNNNVGFINSDFMQVDFDGKFDMIIFSYVLHHLNDPILALKKARSMLSENGKIILSVPGKNYLKETFVEEQLLGRFTIEEMDNIVEEAGLFPLSASRNQFLMSFNSYEMYIKYLKSIGTYQKIINYTNDEWDANFNRIIMNRFSQVDFITGEYLTYNCEDKEKILVRR